MAGTAGRDREATLNAICPYFTMFPLDFPAAALSGLRPGARVLDPFCGRGTTLFAARRLGLQSLGVDASPVATAVARAKIASPSPADVSALCLDLLAGPGDPVPAGAFWERAYHPRTLDAVLRLRAGLRGLGGDAADALRGIVLGALHGPVARHVRSHLSNQMPRTFAPKPAYALRFWESRSLAAPEVDVPAVVDLRAERYYGAQPARVDAVALDGDARTFDAGGEPFDAVVTSPPYFGLDTYRQENWIRLWFLGGPPAPDYGKEGQISFGTARTFEGELAKAFGNVARQCRPGARLAVRFGAIASRRSDPEALLRAALAATGAWRVDRVSEPLYAGAGQRITRQMGERTSAAGNAPEIDLHATREG